MNKETKKAEVTPTRKQNSEYLTEVARRLRQRFGAPADTDFLKSVAQHPVDTLIKTVLSQATNDNNSEQAFQNLKAAYPTWEEVALADPASIAELIRVGGLGAQKAERIKTILEAIKRTAGSYDLSWLSSTPLPEAWAYLIGLPGVGPKTAACTLLFAFGKPVFPVDTHIHRIARRLGVAPQKDSAEKVQQRMQSLLPDDLVESSHVNMISLGREICDARNPKCSDCPLEDLCDYYQASKQQETHTTL